MLRNVAISVSVMWTSD